MLTRELVVDLSAELERVGRLLGVDRSARVRDGVGAIASVRDRVRTAARCAGRCIRLGGAGPAAAAGSSFGRVDRSVRVGGFLTAALVATAAAPRPRQEQERDRNG